MIDESMQLQGAMTLILRRASGEVETVHKDNIIVNVGFDFIADAIGKSVMRLLTPQPMYWPSFSPSMAPGLDSMPTCWAASTPAPSHRASSTCTVDLLRKSVSASTRCSIVKTSQEQPSSLFLSN